MNMIGMHLIGMNSLVNELEENRRELERELRLRQQIRAVRTARRRERLARFGAFVRQLRRPQQPDPCPPLAVEEC